MQPAYAAPQCQYENRASRCGFGVCVLLPVCLLLLLNLGLLQTGKIIPAEPTVTILQIMPAPPEVIPLPHPIEEYSPQPIEPMAPVVAPKPKPAPGEQPKPTPAPKPVDKPVAAPPKETPAPAIQQAAAPQYSETAVKAAAPPQARQMAQGEYDKFLSAFLHKVRQELVYPKAAQRAGISGAVKVSIVFDAEGRVVSYALVNGNYHKTLGEAAEKTIALVKSKWKPPLAPGNRQTIVIPVVFELK